MNAVHRSVALEKGVEGSWSVVLAACRGRMTLEEVDGARHVAKGHTLPNAVSRLHLPTEVRVVGDESSCVVHASIEEVAHRRFMPMVEVWWEGLVAEIGRGLVPPPPAPAPQPDLLRPWAVSGAGLLVGLGTAAAGVDVSLHSASVVSIAVAVGAAALAAESFMSLVRDRGRRPPFAGAPSEGLDRGGETMRPGGPITS